MRPGRPSRSVLALTVALAMWLPISSASRGFASADDLSPLGDEFTNPQTLGSWHQVYADEGWGANQLQGFDIGATLSGWMMLMPYASTWYQDYRGTLVYKAITGDFVATARLRVSRRGGDGPPRSQYSLAGLMARTPRSITPATWTPGAENYVFLSLGAADTPGSYQFEVKTTINSDSQLHTSAAGGGEALIQLARIGPHVILLRQSPGGAWTVHQRYRRDDFPATLQVGLAAYTDWPTASGYTPFQHNSTVITGGNPDLIALVDYVRYHRPKIPAKLRGRAFSDPQSVSDRDLLRFLGAAPARR